MSDILGGSTRELELGQDGRQEPTDGADIGQPVEAEQWAVCVGISEAVCVWGHGRNDGHLHHPASGFFQGAVQSCLIQTHDDGPCLVMFGPQHRMFDLAEPAVSISVVLIQINGLI